MSRITVLEKSFRLRLRSVYLTPTHPTLNESYSPEETESGTTSQFEPSLLKSFLLS